MESISYRVLRDEPGKFEKILKREGIVVLSKGGKPIAVVLETASNSVEDVLRLVSQERAQMAVSEMRSDAREKGLDKFTAEEIQAVIEEVRSSRPARYSMIIVLDTNVLALGLINPFGPPARVVDQAVSSTLQVAYDDRILDEYSEVLSRSESGFDPRNVQDLVDHIRLSDSSPH